MNHFAAQKPNWAHHLGALEILFEEKIVITNDTILAAIEAYKIAASMYPPSELTVPDSVRGKIQL